MLTTSFIDLRTSSSKYWSTGYNGLINKLLFENNKDLAVKLLALVLTLISISSQLHSEEIRYVRDVLYVPLRSGQTNQHRITHKGLVSGTAVTILELSADEKYSHVRTNKGSEGWIQTQYLSDLPAGRDLYEKAAVTIAELQQSNTALSTQLTQLRDREKKSTQQLNGLTSKSSKLNTELASIKKISANAITLNEDNKRLAEENQVLKNEVDVLSTDNKRLNDDREGEILLNGGILVLIGVMITLIVPRLWPKKPTEWS